MTVIVVLFVFWELKNDATRVLLFLLFVALLIWDRGLSSTSFSLSKASPSLDFSSSMVLVKST
jgi:hypothetical protein